MNQAEVLSKEDWSHMDTVAVLTHPNLQNYSLWTDCIHKYRKHLHLV